METPDKHFTTEAQHPTAVLKFGGDVVADSPRLVAVMKEVSHLIQRGWRFLVCHGGNPQANALTSRLKLKRKQVGGRRITDEHTLQVMKQVLAGECNVDVVAAAAGAGIKTVGISGISAGIVTAIRRPPKVFSGCGPKPIDFGFVGEVVEIKPDLIQYLWAADYMPVMNTLGIEAMPDKDGICQVYNINADTISSAVAATLKADHLFLMTGVPGVLRDINKPESRISRLTISEARKAIEDEIIIGGMIPKIEEAIKNLQAGINAIHILGAQAGALEGEATKAGSYGTALLH